MNKIKIKRGLLLAFAVTCVMLASMALVSAHSGNPLEVRRIDSLFLHNTDVTLTLNSRRNPTDDAGVLFSTGKNRSGVALKDTFAGRFEVLMMPYSDTSGTLGFSQAVTTITDKNGNSFDIIAENMNAQWTKVYISDNGKVISDELGTKLTFRNNDNTRLKVYVDPSTGDLGIDNKTFNLDITKLYNLEEFKVGFEFRGVSRKSNLVIYEINGQSLGGFYLNDTGKPIISYKPLSYNAVVGQEYALPEAQATDLIDKGDIGVTYKVIKPDGFVEILSGDTTAYIPQTGGAYEFMLTAADSSGNSRLVRMPFMAQSTYTAQIMIDGIHKPSVTIGKGAVLRLNRAEVVSEYLRSADTGVMIDVEGQQLSAVQDIMYTFNQAGNVPVVYSADLGNGIHAEKIINVNVIDAPYIDINLEKAYSRDYELNIPQSAAHKDGESITTKADIRFPSGRVVVEAAKVVLDEVGEYEVKFRGEHGGVPFEYLQFFEVNTDFDTLITNKTDIELTPAVTAPYYAEKAEGLQIETTSGTAMFDYNSIIDFSTLRRKGTPLLEFMLTPSVQYQSDISAIEFTFTDIDDPTNTLRLYLRDETLAGYELLSNAYAASGNNEYRGNFWDRQLNGITGNGSQPLISMRGAGINGIALPVSKVWFDYTDMSFWGYYGTSDINILTLTNTQHVGKGNEWFGFVNGKAKMNVKIYSKGSMLLLGVAGEKLVGNRPELAIDNRYLAVDYNEQQIPTGLAGTPYRVFDAYINSSIDKKSYNYSVRAFKDYGTPEKMTVDITNRQFVPSEAGQYSLIYSYTRIDGTTQEERVDIEVRDNLPDISISFSGEEEALFANGLTLGKQMQLPQGTINGAEGNYTVEISAAKSTGTSESIVKSFSPLTAGVYTITYKVTDYLNRTTSVDKTITVSNSSGYIYKDDAAPINNGMVLSGKYYDLPNLKAYLYDADGSYEVSDSIITVTYKGQPLEVAANGRFVPAVDNTGEQITVMYTPKDGTGETVSYSLTVIKANDKLYEYFYGAGLTYSTQKDYTQFELAEGLEFGFVNVLPAYSFGFNFSIPSEDNTINAISIILTDSINPDVKIKLTLKKAADGTTEIYINDKFSRKDKNNFADDVWQISYSHETNSFLKGGGTPVGWVGKTLSGEEFAGFGSHKVFLNVELSATGTDNKIKVYAICGNMVDKEAGDYIAPVVYTDYSRSAEYGEIYALPHIIAVDIFDPNISGTISVRAPSGKVVLNGVNAFADYSFEIQEYGTYTISYRITDSSYNSAERSVGVRVPDIEGPVLEIKGQVPTHGKVSKVVNLPDAAAVDKIDGTVKVYVFLTDADGREYRLTQNSFVPAKTGVYRVKYYVQDSSYNYQMQIFAIIVD